MVSRGTLRESGDREAESVWLPRIELGQYADGLALDQIRYLQAKVILKPDRFTTQSSLIAFGKVLKRPAKANGVIFRTDGYAARPLRIRQVQFLDTAGFRLYNNAFILRQRILYRDGVPAGEPEIVFKYRHPDPQQAARMDVRPDIDGPYRIKFKAQVLPKRDDAGALRTLYSHNVGFTLGGPSAGEFDPRDLQRVVQALPVLKTLNHSPGEEVLLVNGTIVEEISQDVGELTFETGHRSVVNVALWRTRSERRPLVGELSFQIKFKAGEDVSSLDLGRGRSFFEQVLWAARDWTQIGATKTGVVYRLSGNPPFAHE